MGKPLILLTGASGTIGTAVMRNLADHYEIRPLTRRKAEFPSFVGDIANLDAILPAFEGVSAVVHLAGSSSVQTSWNDVLHNNLIGTYNVFEAARRANVDRVVFASSNHAIGMYEIDGGPELYELDDQRVYDHTVEVRPDSLYGVSKVYGEALGRYFHDVHQMRVYCLRIGSVRADDTSTPATIAREASWLDMTPEQKRKRLRATWMSQRDCTDLIARCLEVDEPTWAVVYGLSNNPRQFWDLSHARDALGFEPHDSAAVEM
ncbi:MAG: NAD-dependent epimerase/dehydratase family protein [Thermomicrobiales bacterium]